MMTPERAPVVTVSTGSGTGSGMALFAGQPVYIKAIAPLLIICVRVSRTYLQTLLGLLGVGVTTSAIPASDFLHLFLKCAGLSVAAAVVSLLTNLMTYLGQLDQSHPTLTA